MGGGRVEDMGEQAALEGLLLDIVSRLRQMPPDREGTHEGVLSPREVERIVRHHNALLHGNRTLGKRQILPFYREAKARDPRRWASWDIDEALEGRLVRSVRMKPGRTSSGIASVTVLTCPYPCRGACSYCPSDVRMPKSYLSREPACQRAEQNLFDPYLQVHARLAALDAMGHDTGRVELVVLGGTWDDYPEGYRVWFVSELYRALNDFPDAAADEARRERLHGMGLTADPVTLAARTREEQGRVDAGLASYNEAVSSLYGLDMLHGHASLAQGRTSMGCLRAEQRRNESAAYRAVGLSVETRPDAVTPSGLRLLRAMGCTRLQLGIQSTSQKTLDGSARGATVAQACRAIGLARLHGLCVHAHQMANLPGATPASDRRDFARLVSDPALMPDEVKLYPCVAVPSARLAQAFRQGGWQPYPDDELVGLLADDLLATPQHTRISRMVRDIASDDALAGNDHPNLRQEVDRRIAQEGRADEVCEMRHREATLEQADFASLRFDDVAYRTATSEEHLVRSVMPDGRHVAFARLSIPDWEAIEAHACGVGPSDLPIRPGQALVRELRIHGDGRSGQAKALARGLLEYVATCALAHGSDELLAASAVGSREAWRRLGFGDGALFQRKPLGSMPSP